MENPARILIVDDEPSITEFVSYAMQKEGYLTEVASNGEEALEKIESDHFDLFILDIMLPGIDGYELCRRIRAKMTTPILFLSARDSELNKVVGLELGADDYLAKPFDRDELLARIEAILRRTTGRRDVGIVAFKELALHTRTRQAFIADEPLALKASSTTFSNTWSVTRAVSSRRAVVRQDMGIHVGHVLERRGGVRERAAQSAGSDRLRSLHQDHPRSRLPVHGGRS